MKLDARKIDCLCVALACILTAGKNIFPDFSVLQPDRNFLLCDFFMCTGECRRHVIHLCGSTFHACKCRKNNIIFVCSSFLSSQLFLQHTNTRFTIPIAQFTHINAFIINQLILHLFYSFHIIFSPVRNLQ